MSRALVPRLARLLFLLVMPREEDRFSFDHLLQSRAGTATK
jgi:hypothetical protein